MSIEKRIEEVKRQIQSEQNLKQALHEIEIESQQDLKLHTADLARLQNENKSLKQQLSQVKEFYISKMTPVNEHNHHRIFTEKRR